MLIAILNCCTKEELEEEEETPMAITPEAEEIGRLPIENQRLSLRSRRRDDFGTAPDYQKQDSRRRKDVKSLRFAPVGLAVCGAKPAYSTREESERVSELKSISGSASLPAGLLASGAEGIKEAIQGFDDA
jgi:serine/threonine-protein phosphatase 2B catalytic subunit